MAETPAGASTAQPREIRHTRRARVGIAALTVGAAAILVAGILLRPTPQQTPAPAPSELDLARLSRLAERRALDSRTRFLSTLADEGTRAVVWIDSLGTSGVRWQPGLIVVSGSRAPLPAELLLKLPNGRSVAKRIVFAPNLPIAAYERSAAPLPRAAARSPLEKGDWVLAVWQGRDGHSFVPAVYAQTLDESCGDVTVEVLKSTLPLDAAMSGAAVFDADGGLQGIVASCGDAFAVISHRAVDALLDRGRQLENRLLGEFGFRAGIASLDEAAHLKITDGILVREVWNGYPADRSGLRPGDVIRATGERVVETLGDLQPLLQGGGEPHPLKIQRGAQALSITLPAPGGANAPVPERPFGLSFESDLEGYRIGAVVPESAASEAGLRAGDTIVRVNHAEPRNLTVLKRLLAARRSVSALLEVERAGRRFAILIPQE